MTNTQSSAFSLRRVGAAFHRPVLGPGRNEYVAARDALSLIRKFDGYEPGTGEMEWHRSDDGTLTGTRATTESGSHYQMPRFELREYSDGRMTLSCKAEYLPVAAIGDDNPDVHADERIQATLRDVRTIALANIARRNPHELLATAVPDSGGHSDRLSIKDLQAAFAARVVGALRKVTPSIDVDINAGDSPELDALLNGGAFDIVGNGLAEANLQISMLASAISQSSGASASERRRFKTETERARHAAMSRQPGRKVTANNIAELERLADSVVLARDRVTDLVTTTRESASYAAKALRDMHDTGEPVVKLTGGYRIENASSPSRNGYPDSRPERVLVNSAGQAVEPVGGKPADQQVARNFLVASKTLTVKPALTVA